MKKQSARLASVSTGPAKTLAATCTDGRVLRVDLADVAHRLAMFAPLEDPAEFMTATVSDFGWTLEWACGASLDSDRLLEMALEQSGLVENVRFRHWQEDHHLSLSAAATAIGLSRRTVSQYRTGARPVPRTVALACKGWESEIRSAEE